MEKKKKTRVKAIITEVKNLDLEDKEQAEAIKELEDLLIPEATIFVEEDQAPKVFLGFHPITGEKVYK